MKRKEYIEKRHHQTFEEIKEINEFGQESWSARELQSVLEYGSWDKFKRVIEKASTACKKAGQPVDNHFSQTGKMVKIGSGAEREVEDHALSRHACYLIVQNGEWEMTSVQKRIQTLESKLTKTRKKMDGYLKELGF